MRRGNRIIVKKKDSNKEFIKSQSARNHKYCQKVIETADSYLLIAVKKKGDESKLKTILTAQINRLFDVPEILKGVMKFMENTINLPEEIEKLERDDEDNDKE